MGPNPWSVLMLHQEILIFQARGFNVFALLGVCNLATNAIFQINVSKFMPARLKNMDHGMRSSHTVITCYTTISYITRSWTCD